ncbi:MAG: hypothetical protein ACE5Z5_04825 [Candidatus Bathyarchaeia archaeon]
MRISNILAPDEWVRLIVCVALDVVEYLIPHLLAPIFGDVLDVIGVVACIVMFGWMGLLASIELIPLADILPVYVIVWALWFFVRRFGERERWRRWKEGIEDRRF